MYWKASIGLKNLTRLPSQMMVTRSKHWLAAALGKFGWSASVTTASKDQGVDVLARKDGLSVAIQAKRYAGKVGNKAVQEVYSGARHLGLSAAAVVTTVGFTRSARELAGSTGVTLLHVEDLPRLEAMVKSKF